MSHHAFYVNKNTTGKHARTSTARLCRVSKDEYRESLLKSAILDEIRWIMKSSVIERILQNGARIEQGLVKDYGRGTPKNAVRHRETVQNTI